MRFLTGLALLTAVLLAGCGAAPGVDAPMATGEPAATAASVAPLPTRPPLPTATELPATTPLPAATELPAATPLPPATPLPAATPLPTVAPLPPATALPTVVPLPPATPRPTMAPLPAATALPPPIPTPDLALPLVTIGAFTWPVELALTGEQQAQGLSGRAELAAGAGMLFVWNQESRRSFWMPDMNFPLDMVWLNGDCAVTHITHNAPPQAPGQSQADLPRYTVDQVQYVLEINAGEAALHGIKVGDQARFQGRIAGEYGC